MFDWGITITSDNHNNQRFQGARDRLTCSSIDLLCAFVEYFDLPEREDIAVSIAELTEFVESEAELPSTDVDKDELLELKEYLDSTNHKILHLYAWW